MEKKENEHMAVEDENEKKRQYNEKLYQRLVCGLTGLGVSIILCAIRLIKI